MNNKGGHASPREIQGASESDDSLLVPQAPLQEGWKDRPSSLTTRQPSSAWERLVEDHFSWWPGFKKQAKRFLGNPLSFTGVVLIIIFALIAIFAPWLAPPDPLHRHEPYRMPRDGFALTPRPPQAQAWKTFPPDWRKHPFGTMEGQYDIYYGIIWGARNAFRIGVVVVGIAVLIGIAIGSLSGYFGGWVDQLLMRLVDILLSFPTIVLAIVLVTILGNQRFEIFGVKVFISRLTALIIAFTFTQWLTYARLIRGDVLSIKEKEFIQAAQAVGGGNLRIILKHVLPNAVYPVLIAASLDIGAIVLSVAALSFLGLGPGTDFADWGQIISYSREWILGSHGNPFNYWYVIIIPSLAITLFVLAWNLLGDALRDVLDPRLRGRA
jgi:peptide/nickel transport system permease protein